MKKINFAIEKSSSFMVPGRVLDVHNNFDFSNLDYSILDDVLILSWVKTKGEWVPEDEVNEFDLIFERIHLLKIDGVLGAIDSANRNLSYCGYLHPDDINVMDGCLDEHESEFNYHLIFVFDGNFTLKLYADKVSYVEKASKLVE